MISEASILNTSQVPHNMVKGYEKSIRIHDIAWPRYIYKSLFEKKIFYVEYCICQETLTTSPSFTRIHISWLSQFAKKSILCDLTRKCSYISLHCLCQNIFFPHKQQLQQSFIPLVEIAYTDHTFGSVKVYMILCYTAELVAKCTHPPPLSGLAIGWDHRWSKRLFKVVVVACKIGEKKH